MSNPINKDNWIAFDSEHDNKKTKDKRKFTL